jgi:ribonuclease BN (tRNA processing enzyme)
MSFSALLRWMSFWLWQGFVGLPAYAAASCVEQNVSLQVLGSGGPELDDGRASTSYLIWHNNRARVLVDAGPGSSVNFGRSTAQFADLDVILLSHLHVDHSSDLPAYIKGAYFSNRQRILPVYGPDKNTLMPSTTEFVERLFGAKGVYPYLSDNLSVPEDVANKTDKFTLHAQDIPLTHDNVVLHRLSPNLSVSAMAVHHGPVAALAWRVNLAGCLISFSGDMSNQWHKLAMFAKEADLLVMHNAVPEQTNAIARNLHMPPSEIGKIAQQAKVKQLLLSHFMNRTNHVQAQTVAIIQQHYAGKVSLADDLMHYKLGAFP